MWWKPWTPWDLSKTHFPWRIAVTSGSVWIWTIELPCLEDFCRKGSREILDWRVPNLHVGPAPSWRQLPPDCVLLLFEVPSLRATWDMESLIHHTLVQVPNESRMNPVRYLEHGYISKCLKPKRNNKTSREFQCQPGKCFAMATLHATQISKNKCCRICSGRWTANLVPARGTRGDD